MDFKGAITGDHILFLLKGLLITLEVALIAINYNNKILTYFHLNFGSIL